MFPGLPAAEAGVIGAYRNSRGDILLGDVITHIDDLEIRSNDDYFSALESHKPGDTVTLRTRRAESEQRFTIKLIEPQ